MMHYWLLVVGCLQALAGMVRLSWGEIPITECVFVIQSVCDSECVCLIQSVCCFVCMSLLGRQNASKVPFIATQFTALFLFIYLSFLKVTPLPNKVQ